MIGLDFQDLTIERLGLGDPTGLMKRCSLPED